MSPTVAPKVEPRQEARTGSAVVLEHVFQHVGIHRALDDVSLQVAQGEMLLIIGPNGAGKTLLTRIMLGLDRPSAGAVRLLGADLDALGNAAMRRLRLRVGAVLQGSSLLEGLTVLENLLLPMRAAGASRQQMVRAAQLAVTQLQLDGLEGHRPRALSLGQRRRVELARALINRPEVLIWDGVGDGLDPAVVRDIVAVLRLQQQARGLTVIATDNAALDAFSPDCRVAVLERGRLLLDTSPAEISEALPNSVTLRVIVEGRP